MEYCPKIAVFGAGISGICCAIKLKAELGLNSFVMFEENQEVGGTWLVNTYPGLTCDVPSHLYGYSFEPNSNWSKAYAGQQEILEYLQNVAKKHDLYKRIKFQHKVVSAEWVEEIQKWRVTVDNNEGIAEYHIFDIIVSAIGGLRVPNIPEKFARFEKPMMHSAQWDSTIDLNNKVVALVGSGASAVQIVPEIVDKVKKLIVYQRHPAWIIPKRQMTFSSLAKWTFANIPGTRWFLRSLIFWATDLNHSAFKPNTLLNWISVKIATRLLTSQVPNVELREKLTPNYEFGCKRIIPSNEYYPALVKSHVTVYNCEISEVTQDSIIGEDGLTEKPDILILATGFKVQDYFAPVQVTVKGGEDLLKIWKTNGPCAYCGVVCHYAPNAFFIVGPNTGLGHNSLIFSIECQVYWIIKVIREMKIRNAKMVSIKKSAEMKYMEEMLTAMKSTVWGTASCGSWYSDSRGVVTALWPKNLVSYYNQMKQVDFTQFDFA